MLQLQDWKIIIGNKDTLTDLFILVIYINRSIPDSCNEEDIKVEEL